MRPTRRSAFAAAAIALFALLGVGQAWLQNVAQAQARTVEAPKFEVDPMWPKPLPNHWVIGAVIGVAVDARITSGSSIATARSKPRRSTPPPPRPPPSAALPRRPCCSSTRPATSIAHWGGPGPGYEWPASNHGIDVDYKGNVWIGGNGRGQQPAALAHDESKMAARDPSTTASCSSSPSPASS